MVDGRIVIVCQAVHDEQQSVCWQCRCTPRVDASRHHAQLVAYSHSIICLMHASQTPDLCILQYYTPSVNRIPRTRQLVVHVVRIQLVRKFCLLESISKH